MVVGIVIGSGVFFKAQDILNYTDGNMLLAVLAWIIGGVVMIICAYNFANFATRYVKVNGIVDYAEAAVGKKYGKPVTISGPIKYAAPDKQYIIRIEIDEADFDGNYVDPNVLVRSRD